MNFLDKHPSENRMEFTKLKVARKYASIGSYDLEQNVTEVRTQFDMAVNPV